MRRYTRRHVGGAREQLIYKTHYTKRYYEKCAQLAKKRTDNFLLTRLVMDIKNLGKSREWAGAQN